MAKKAVAPSFGQELGLMYKRWTLDCVVTIAHAVAVDFSDRPELYRQVADDIAAKLTELQASYGFQANFPDMPIRQRLMKPVFGESDGHGSGNDGSAFQAYRLPVLTPSPPDSPCCVSGLKMSSWPLRPKWSIYKAPRFLKRTAAWRLSSISLKPY